jgi:alpha-mannosidase
LIAIVGEIHKGRRPASYSFVQLKPKNLILTTIKKAEDDEAWIVQWYDAKGLASQSTLSLPTAPVKVLRSDFLEADGVPEDFKGMEAHAQTKKSSITTLKIYFGKRR